MEIITKTLAELDSKQYRACYSLNMRTGGLMQESLMYAKDEYPAEAKAIMAWADEVLLGWVLLVPTKQKSAVWVSDYAKKVSKYTVQIYVRGSHRRRGLARTLMDEAIRHDPRPHVVPWSDESYEFFSDYTVATESWRRVMMNRAKKNKRARAR